MYPLLSYTTSTHHQYLVLQVCSSPQPENFRDFVPHRGTTFYKREAENIVIICLGFGIENVALNPCSVAN